MAFNHGMNTYKNGTNFAAVKSANVGIAIYFGAWPCHTAGGYVNKPQLATSYAEAEKLGGYSDEWRTADGSPKWTLCQAIYAHFKLFAVAPVIFCNVFDPAKHKTAVQAATFDVVDHIVELPFEAINNDALVVKTTANSTNLVLGTDYNAFYDNGKLIIELIETGTAYAQTKLSIAYDKATPEAITAADIEAAIEKVEMCKTLIGIVPDLLAAPGWSSNSTVAAVLAAKAGSINGIYRAKAVVDIDTSANAANDYTKLLAYKNSNGYTDKDMLVSWPLAKAGDKVFDMSVIACCDIASVDSNNADVPYESPSNKSIPITGLCNKAGEEVSLTLSQADIVSYTYGVVTAINNGGWVLWGNYLACWPTSTDAAESFICTSRMLDFVCNTFVNTYWSYLDRPLTRPLIDAICNSFNTWLDSLTHDGKLLGGQIQYIADNNPVTDLLLGKFRLDTKMASPVPAQRIDLYTEFDVEMLNSALNI